jgi:antitoxin component of RelBE/YafQ-DinJ toxin-antitoxin module
MHFFVPNYQRQSVAARKKMGITASKNMRMTVRKMAERKIIGMPTVMK